MAHLDAVVRDGAADAVAFADALHYHRTTMPALRQHAQATQVEVSSIGRRDGSIGITVSDNGVGLPAHRRRGKPLDETGGIGLWSIDHRLRDFDAVLDIEAAPGEGTRAMLILPAHLVVCD